MIDVAQELLERQVVERISHPRLQRQLGALVERLVLPEEIGDGDLIVSVASASLPDAAGVEITRLNHVQLNADPELIDRVLNDVFAPPGAPR